MWLIVLPMAIGALAVVVALLAGPPTLGFTGQVGTTAVALLVSCIFLASGISVVLLRRRGML
jgi:hypothetical protein